MTFSNFFDKLSLMGDAKLRVLFYLAFYPDNNSMYGNEYRKVCQGLHLSDREVFSLVEQLQRDNFAYMDYYTMTILPIVRIPVLAYAYSKRHDIIEKYKKIFQKNALYELVGYAFCGGPRPAGQNLIPLCDIDYLTGMPVSDPQVCRFASFYEPEAIRILTISSVNNRHLLGERIGDDTFDLWRAEFGKHGAETIRHINGLQAYHQFVQDGHYDYKKTDGEPKNLFMLMIDSIQACNAGDYQGCLDTLKLASALYPEPGYPCNMLPMFFTGYYMMAACLHLSNTKTSSIAKKMKAAPGDAYNIFGVQQVLADIALDPHHQANESMLRNVMAMSSIHGRVAKNSVFMLQMIARHFDVPDIPYTTGEPEYAIVRHEVTPIDKQSPELVAAYGNMPAVLTLPFKRGWEYLLDEVTDKLSGNLHPAEKPAKLSRRIYVLNEYTNEVAAMTQQWLKSQRWGKPKPLSMSAAKSIDEDADKYDEAFARLCNSAYYWPKASIALPVLKGCDRLFMAPTRHSSELRELVIEDQAPYIEIVKKGSFFSVSSNVPSFDINDKSIVKKDAGGKYVCITLSDKARSVLRLLLSQGQTFPLAAEERLRSIVTMLDEVVEVRSKLLDFKALPTYKGRPTIVVKLQPMANGIYEAIICAHPLPDSTKTPPPGEGRKEIIDSIAGSQVKVERDLDGERATYTMLCDALDNVNGVDLYEDEYRGSLTIEAVLELMSWAQAHSDLVAIDWLQGKPMQLKQAAGSSWNVGLKSHNGWFDIEGDVRIDNDTVLTMAQMLDMVQQSKGKYLRLTDDLFIAIDKKLRRQLERIEAMAVRNRNRLQISQINAAMLDDAALDGGFKLNIDQKLLDLQQRVKDTANYTPAVPAALKAELRPYQVEGFQWMSRLASWGAGACLADDMGLGKTVQTIAFLLLKAAEGPALVVAPASVVPNWASEIERFAPSLRVAILNKADDRSKTIRCAHDYDVILSTYGLLNTEEDVMVEKKWSTICLDEAHTIKNKETKMSGVAMRLQADYRIILTGTPIQNHLGEIWNLFRFINPGLLGGFDTFRQKFVKPITEDNDKGRRKALQGILRPFMLRRTKDEVIDDLPEKNEITIPVELSDAELTRYEALRKKAAQEISTADKVDINTLAEITRLRRAACSMALVDPSWTGQDSKVQAFLDIVAEFKGNGSNRMLVFSQFTSYLDIVRKALDHAGERYLYLDGSTTMKQREQLVAQFRNGDIPLFLISLKAGGLGLNLPEANYVMHLDPWWNPAIEQQATDRAYRIGQKRDVTVYHLVAKNTIEEKILRLHHTKRDLADSLLEGTDMAGKLTLDDILALITNA